MWNLFYFELVIKKIRKVIVIDIGTIYMYFFLNLLFFLIVNEVGGKCLLNLKLKYGQVKTSSTKINEKEVKTYKKRRKK